LTTLSLFAIIKCSNICYLPEQPEQEGGIMYFLKYLPASVPLLMALALFGADAEMLFVGGCTTCILLELQRRG